MAQHGGKRENAGRKPGSKNKSTAEIKELAALWSESAIHTLVDLMENDPSGPTRLAAARELLDRAHGRPRPATDPEAGPQGNHKGLSDFYNNVEEAKSKMVARVESLVAAKRADN